MKIATLCLASCTGCHMALVDLQATFLDLVAQAELVFSPLLVDRKAMADVDLVLVEGSVRTDEDRARLIDARARGRTLVALGTCATFGGVPGLANALPANELVEAVYGRDGLGGGAPDCCPRLLPVDSYVDVDYFIPGCPPPLDHLSSILRALVAGTPPPRIETPVCSECRRVARPEPLDDLVRPHARHPEPEKCLLVQGFLCLGSVTRGGCGAACTNTQVPCTGCRGPTDHVLLESRHGMYRDMLNRIGHLLGIPAREAEAKLRDVPHLLYSYSLASPALRGKDAESVARLTHRIEERRA